MKYLLFFLSLLLSSCGTGTGDWFYAKYNGKDISCRAVYNEEGNTTHYECRD